MKLPAKSTTPKSYNYRPEPNSTADLDVNNITMFQELIGELIWDTEIGRVDILHEVLVLSAFQASPCEGHLHQVFHIFYFMINKPKLTINFDPIFPNIYPTSFPGSSAEEFREQYRDGME